MNTDTRTEADTPVPDVGAATPGWLREATKLAMDHGLGEIGAALESLAAQRGRQALRLAVIGEPSKGKSTLVNRLLGRNLLPTGPLAAMRATVVVGAGQADELSAPQFHRLHDRLPSEWWHNGHPYLSLLGRHNHGRSNPATAFYRAFAVHSRPAYAAGRIRRLLRLRRRRRGEVSLEIDNDARQHAGLSRPHGHGRVE